jgi:hypothetical protein
MACVAMLTATAHQFTRPISWLGNREVPLAPQAWCEGLTAHGVTEADSCHKDPATVVQNDKETEQTKQGPFDHVVMLRCCGDALQRWISVNSAGARVGQDAIPVIP